jgi:acetyltransferase-like isoleucine patch superfamily enzyme
VKIGKHSYGIGGVNYDSAFEESKLEIGNYSSIGEGVRFLVAIDHRVNLISTYPFNEKHHHSKGPIIIGNDVWIGMNAIILSGVTIGDGAVIGAGAVVSKDIPPYAVAVGSPAVVKHFRFSPEQIERLLEIRWWDWPEEKMLANVDLLGSDRLEELFAL